MSTSRRETEFVTAVTGTQAGTGNIFDFYAIPADASILAEARCVTHDADNIPALSSACFVSVAAIRRLGNATAGIISSGTPSAQIIVSKVENGTYGATALTWVTTSNVLSLQLATAGGTATAYFTCEIRLIIN